MFSIHSVSSDRELIFSNRKEEYFFVELKSSSLSASTEVWTGINSSLHTFFQKLANFKTPWKDEQVWEAFEGEFKISATCTTVGHVIFWIKLSGSPGGAEEWKAETGLETELGQLERIAKNANIFFKRTSA
ncbi:MAG: DUF6228 family protein [Anaerolineales bacterium]